MPVVASVGVLGGWGCSCPPVQRGGVGGFLWLVVPSSVAVDRVQHGGVPGGLRAASLLGLVCWSSAGRGRLLGAPAASGAVRLSVYIIVVFRAGAGLFGALLRVCSSGWVASVANIRPSGGYCVNFSVRGCPALVNFKKKDEFNSRNLLTKRFLDGIMQNIGGVQNDR